MAKRRKITLWIIVCLLWETLVVGVHIFMRSQLKFPALNLEVLGWLVPIFMAVPLVALVFGVASVHRKRLMKTIAVIFTFLGVLIYVAYVGLVTFGFTDWKPGLYPLMSKTQNVENYLVLDGRFDKNYDEITKIMPKSVPKNAKNVSYNYEYDPTSRASVSAAWELPENEYITFKNESLNKGLLSSAKASDYEFFEYKWNVEEVPAFHGWMIVVFDDINFSVKCIVKQNYGS